MILAASRSHRYLRNIHVDMWRLRSEEFFAGLGRKRCIVERQDDVANGDVTCSLLFLDPRRKVILLHMSWSVPRCKESVLSEVSIVEPVRDGQNQ